MASGTFWLANVSPDTEWTFFIAPLAIIGLGFGALQGPTINNTLRDISETQVGIASGISYTIFLIGTELGIAISGTVLQNQFRVNMEDALSETAMPDEAIEEITSPISENGFQSSGGTEYTENGDMMGTLFETAFSDSVNTALLWFSISILGGLIISIFFSRNKKRRKNRLSN